MPAGPDPPEASPVRLYVCFCLRNRRIVPCEVSGKFPDPLIVPAAASTSLVAIQHPSSKRYAYDFAESYGISSAYLFPGSFTVIGWFM